MTRNFTLLLAIFICGAWLAQAQTALEAGFSAKEAVKEIYRQGFDTPKEMTGWSVSPTTTNYDYTWDLGNVQNKNIKDFSTIDPTSKQSAVIYYSADESYQDETLCSPYFLLEKNTLLRVYTAFSGIWAYQGRFTIHAQKKSAETAEKIFDAFMWSQENRHEYHKWIEFEFDLSKYTSDKDSVRILFRYTNSGGGDDVYIDNFRLYETDDSGNVSVEKGGEVHFIDQSTGEPDGYEWTFEGGTPATSTDANPTVRYEKAGTYAVTLKVSKNGQSDETTQQGFVTVKANTPVADFEYPATGYFSPYAGIYVPVNTPVTFTDRSGNLPESWLWQFEGGTPATSEEQNPTIVYETPGAYELSLTATNEDGSQTVQSPVGAVKAGGDCSIWNIGSDESHNIDAINLGFAGYYGGTNWVGMVGFAERFKKPLVPVELSKVDIYFATATVIEPAVELTVSVAKEKDGLPGEIVASKTISSDDITFDPSTWLPTTFELDQPIVLDTTFFVIIEGMPNRTDEATNETDDLSIGAVRRDFDTAVRKGTSYHLLEEWDANDQPTGKTQWHENSDENVSLAIAPYVRYTNEPNTSAPLTEVQKPEILQQGRNITLAGASAGRLECIDVQGRVLHSRDYAGETLHLPFDNGIYLLRLTQGIETFTYKIKL